MWQAARRCSGVGKSYMKERACGWVASMPLALWGLCDASGSVVVLSPDWPGGFGRGCSVVWVPAVQKSADWSDNRANRTSLTTQTVVAVRGLPYGRSMSLRCRRHELSIPRGAMMVRGWQPASNASMMRILPPQHGHGWHNTSGSVGSSGAASLPSWSGSATSSSALIFARLSARLAWAKRP